MAESIAEITGADRRNAAHGGTLVVTRKRAVAEDVVELTLARPDGTRLPDWAPGAHIDIVLPDGTHPAVLPGRRPVGCAQLPHRRAARARRPGRFRVHPRPGSPKAIEVGFGGPRNNFRAVARRRLPVHRRRHRHHADHADDPPGRAARPTLAPDLPRPLARAAGVSRRARGVRRARHDALPPTSSAAPRSTNGCRPPTPFALRVYACGPERHARRGRRLGGAAGRHRVASRAVHRPRRRGAPGDARSRSRSHAPARSSPSPATRRSSRRCAVSASTSSPPARRACAARARPTCCDGVPDHRDSLLDDAERAASLCMFPCVSRSLGPRLVLDPDPPERHPMTPHYRARPVSSIDPFSDEFLAEPAPVPREAARARPGRAPRGVRRVRDGALRRGAPLRSPTGRRCSPAPASGSATSRTEKPWRPPSLLLEADPPRHDAPRAVLSQLLSPRRLRDARGAVEGGCRAASSTSCSRAAPSSTPSPNSPRCFPLRVFPDAVGIGKSGREHLLPYGDFAFNAFGPAERARDRRRAATIGADDRVDRPQCLRENLTDDGFGAQIWAAADRGEITPEQAPLIVRSMLTAGVDTTVTGIAAIMHALATTPRGSGEPPDAPTARCCRAPSRRPCGWTSPVQTFFRTTTVETVVAGTAIPTGEKMLMFLGAANRDPRRWDDPDRFDLSRDPSGHVAFGMGLHQCVGQHIARLEAICVLGRAARPGRRHRAHRPPTSAPQQHPRRLGAHAGAGHPGLNEAGTDAAASVPAVDRSVRR